jgi:hypothetical protein
MEKGHFFSLNILNKNFHKTCFSFSLLTLAEGTPIDLLQSYNDNKERVVDLPFDFSPDRSTFCYFFVHFYHN